MSDILKRHYMALSADFDYDAAIAAAERWVDLHVKKNLVVDDRQALALVSNLILMVQALKEDGDDLQSS